MTKLVSRNPILRFKEGRKIIKALGGDNHYIGTNGNTDLYTRSAKSAGVTNRDQVRNLQRLLGMSEDQADGIWGKNTQSAWEKANSTLYTPGIHYPGNGTFVPLTTTPTRNLNEAVSAFPSLYNVGDKTFNRDDIRKNRGVNYSNVDEYWNYLNSEEGIKSDDYKLWQNLYGPGIPEKDRRIIFDLVMQKFGIRGNLGKRDSNRLANILNALSGIGTTNSDVLKSFINGYDNAMNAGQSNQLFALNNVTLNSSQLTDYNSKMLEIKLKYGLKFKKGGLIPRKAVDQFKLRKGF